MSTVLEVRPLAEQAQAEIRRLILAGDLRLGQQVSEDVLAARLGISRTPVREALRRLTEEGLIEAGGRLRARVASLDDAGATAIAQVRGELDALASALCAERREAADVQRLTTMAEAVEARHAEGDLAALFAADAALHLEFAACSGNRELLAHLRRIDGRVQLWRLHHQHDLAKVGRDILAHRRVIDRIAAGDAAGAADIARHHARGEWTPS